jgi:energy-converting hydrogenase Eha subunit G
MIVHLVVLGALALAVCVMFLYRRWVEDHDDHNIHLHNTATDSRIIHMQEDAAKRLELVEKALRYLTIIVVVYGVVLAGYAIYTEWITSQ